MTHIQNMVPLPICLINTSVPVETARSSTNSLLVVPKIALNTFKTDDATLWNEHYEKRARISVGKDRKLIFSMCIAAL